jgi:hypothetical protein
MEKNLLKKWIDENNIDTEGLPKTWTEASIIMRKAYVLIDAMSIAELETFAKNGNNKVYIAIYWRRMHTGRRRGYSGGRRIWW